jgi:integrase
MKEQQAPQKKSRKSSKVSWPRIHTQSLPSGQRSFVIDVQVAGSRIFKRFYTMKEAEAEAVKLREQRQREGTAGFELPAAIRVEAVKAVEMLKPFNVSLVEAVTHYVTHVAKFRESPTIAQAVQLLLADKIANGRRERTVQDLRQRWCKFADTFGTRRLGEVTPDEISQWLTTVTANAHNRHNYRRKVAELYRAGVRKRWCTENIVDQTDRPIYDKAAPGILTVAQLKALLAAAPKYDLLPFVVLGTFCGIRVSELETLTWDKINLVERAVIIESGTAKTRARRVVTIGDAAYAWLLPYAQKTGPIVDAVNLRKRFDELKVAAKIAIWPENGMRHSFGSYALAQWQDETKVAYQMGNSPAMVHQHYKQLVLASEAKKFWELLPDADAKIVPMVANA